MAGGVWGWLATPAMSILVAIVMVAVLVRCKFHRNKDGSLSRRRLASVFVLSASVYTFLVGASSELFFHGPSLSTIIREGFGDARVSWLLIGVVTDGVFRIWDEFRQMA